MFHTRFLSALVALVAIGAIVAAPIARAADKVDDEEAERLEKARTVFLEMRDLKDEKIPHELIERARCVAVFPGVVKGALGWGARHGHGVMSCRDASGHWGPPIFLTVTGGSFGFQLGIEKADVVLFFMNDKSARSLVDSKFTVGGKAGVAAGPVGRTAEASTDIKLDAEIYSYARSKGLFAGVSLEGAKIAPDKKAIQRFYGKAVNPRVIVFEHRAPTNPPSAQAFVEALP
jgi:lipid-binding SYLF domain-containing protein